MEDLIKIGFYVAIATAIYYLLPYVLLLVVVISVGLGILAVLPCDEFKDRIFNPLRERYLRNKYEGKHAKNSR